MAVCKRCGCAIPLGQKTCDICDRTGASTPAPSGTGWTPAPQPVVDWQAQPSTPVGTGADPLAPLTSTPTLPILPAERPHRDIARWQASHRWAWRYLATLGVLYVGLGLITALGYLDDFHSLFGWVAVVVGLSFCWFAFMVRQGSLLAMSMAILVYGAYTAAFLSAGSFVIFRVLILLSLGRAWLSIYALRQYQQRRVAAPPANQSLAA